MRPRLWIMKWALTIIVAMRFKVGPFLHAVDFGKMYQYLVKRLYLSVTMNKPCTWIHFLKAYRTRNPKMNFTLLVDLDLGKYAASSEKYYKKLGFFSTIHNSTNSATTAGRL